MQTLFEAKKEALEAVSFDEINNQQGTVLPKREELSVINYNIGYPYAGYDGYHSSQTMPNHNIDNHINPDHRNPDYRFDCYKAESNYENVRYDHDYWKQYEGANDRNITYSRPDNGLHMGQYKNDGYAPYVAYNTYYSAPPIQGYEAQPVNTYSGYSGYSSYPAYGYSGTPYGTTYNPYSGYHRA
jgi:hypothetical protein